nr:flagellar basal body rod protein FlgB [Chromobacterium sp. ASV5]
MHLDKALSVHPEALRLRAERTRILASNIANENTPGYQARDIDFKSALASARADSPFSLDTADGGDLLYRLPNHPSRDGNTVELGVEQAEFAQNVSEFQTSLAFINMKLRGLAKVIAGQ